MSNSRKSIRLNLAVETIQSSSAAQLVLLGLEHSNLHLDHQPMLPTSAIAKRRLTH